MTEQGQGAPTETVPEGRPEDVETGFWLWLVAVPLMVVGYVVNLVTVPDGVVGPKGLVYAVSGVFVVVVASVVVTFLLLMRQGYRWTRTLLTGSAAATLVYALTNLFDTERPAPAAMAYAASTIVGAVCIVGGAYLVHRKDGHGFFSR